MIVKSFKKFKKVSWVKKNLVLVWSIKKKPYKIAKGPQASRLTQIINLRLFLCLIVVRIWRKDISR